MTEEAKQLLDQVVKDIKANSFVPGYREDATPEECLGLALAHYFDWDSRIVRACTEALTDANFHQLSAVLTEAADQYFI